MADVAEDRGQIILLMGLLLAIAFVMLAVLLNTVIFTENIASRGTDFGGRDAMEFRRIVQTDVGQLVDEENHEDYATNTSVRANVSDGVSELGRLIRLRRAESGAVSELTVISMANGALIRQTDETRNLTSASGAVNWTLARSITDARGVVVNVSGGLNSTADPRYGFKVVLEEAGGGAEWRVAVYVNGSSTEIAVRNGSEPTWSTAVCSPSNAPTIDLTAGTVDGTRCSALSFAKGVSAPYDIQFERADLAEGTYELTVNVSGAGSVSTTDLNGPGRAASPYFSRAVYSVSVEVFFDSSNVVYRSPLRIARGEPE